MNLSVQSGRPIIHEVLLVDDEKQAYARCIGANLNRGKEAARAAAAMIDIFQELDRSMPKNPTRSHSRNA
jgi:6,7-dimethyl-8-ribityllumazine synthase